MPLTVLLPLPATGVEHDRLWPDWRVLAAALAPGDRIVAVVAGPTTAINRFTDEHGWGAADIEILAVDAGTSSADLDAAGLSESRGAVLRIGPGEQIVPAGLQQLRVALDGGADLVVANHMWHVAGPEASLPCADAGRWSEALADPDPAAAARRLLPDPNRLVPYAPHGGREPEAAYDIRLAAAERVALVVKPVVLRPPGPDRTCALLTQTPVEIKLHMLRLDDALLHFDPGQAHLVLDTAAAFLARLPRSARKHAITHAGPAGRLLAALKRRDHGAALGLLALAAAARDRAVSEAVAAQIAALRADFELALPGPDYLRETYEWLRRP